MHAEFPLTRVWQPDGPCAPSDSGLNQALCFLWHGANHRFDAVSGRVVSTDNTTYAGSEKGKAPQCAVSQVNIEWANYQPCVTSNGAGSGDFAMSVLANPAASGGGSANEHGLAQKNDAAGGDFAQAVILFHGNSSGAYTSGSACFYTFQGAVTAVAAASVCDGRWHLWTGVRSGTNLYLYKDGILIASGSGTLRNISQANRYVAIGSRGNGTTGSYRNQAALAAMWNRAPSATEVAELADNPWQLFEPEPIDVYWAAAAPGGSTIVRQMLQQGLYAGYGMAA